MLQHIHHWHIGTIIFENRWALIVLMCLGLMLSVGITWLKRLIMMLGLRGRVVGFEAVSILVRLLVSAVVLGSVEAGLVLRPGSKTK